MMSLRVNLPFNPSIDFVAKYYLFSAAFPGLPNSFIPYTRIKFKPSSEMLRSAASDISM